MKDILDGNKIVGKAKSSKISLKYQHLGDLCLIVFSDAALGTLTDGSSQGGYVIFLVGKSGKFSPPLGNSKKIHRVVRSTLAAETISMCELTDMVVFTTTFFTEIITGKDQPHTLPLA